MCHKMAKVNTQGDVKAIRKRLNFKNCSLDELGFRQIVLEAQRDKHERLCQINLRLRLVAVWPVETALTIEFIIFKVSIIREGLKRWRMTCQRNSKGRLPAWIEVGLRGAWLMGTKGLRSLRSFCSFSQGQLSAWHIHAISQLPVGTGSYVSLAKHLF